MKAHALGLAHHFLDVDLVMYLEGFVYLIRGVRVIFDTVDGHQVHTNGCPKGFSVHVNVAVAALSHLESILGLTVDRVCQLWTEFVQNTEGVLFPVEVFDNVEGIISIELFVCVE